MDITRLRTGEKVAAGAGILLFLSMFIFKWFGLSFEEQAPSENAWGSFRFIDIVLLIASLAAIGLAATSATQRSTGLPVALSSIVAALGILATLLVLIRLISPPDFGVDDAFFDQGVEKDRKFGAFLGLILSAGIAAGGWLAMKDEGTSFRGEAERAQGRYGGGPSDPGAGGPPSGGGPGYGGGPS